MKYLAFLVLVACCSAANLRGDFNCSNFKSESDCSSNSCQWCKSAAVPSACYAPDMAKKLPPAVFVCDKALETPYQVDPAKWSTCGSSTDDVDPSNVQVSIVPNPVVKGSTVNVTVSGTTSKDITKVTAQVKVYMSVIEVYHTTVDDACKYSQYVTCPIKKGPFVLNTIQTMPSSAPAGHYKAQVTLLDQDGVEITCLKLDIHL